MKQKFKDQFERLCLLDQLKKDEMTLIGNFNCPSMDAFDKEYKQELTKLQKDYNIKQLSERYKKFAAEIDKVVFLDDDEAQGPSNVTMFGDGEIELKETQQYIDPISKTQILDPVRNKRCNHVYERSTIEAAIKLNKRLRCAYMGCSNKFHVTLSDLEDDPQLKATLRRLFTQMEQEQDENED